MLNFGNKEFRNLQEQVLKNAQDIEVLKEKPGLRPVVVDELPETGEEGILYLVPSDDPETENVYNEYVWVAETESFEMVGSTAIDLSGLVTLDTAQTISGAKSFTSDVSLQSDINVGGDVIADGMVVIGATGYDIKKDGSNMVIEADGNAIKVRGDLIPNTSSTYSLGSGTNYWKSINLSHYVNWGSGAMLRKDDSNRVCITNGSDDKLKIGAAEIVCKDNFSPDQDSQYSLGKENLRWSQLNAGRVQNKYSSFFIEANGDVNIKCSNACGLVPSSNNVFTLGKSGQIWSTVYAESLSDGSNVVVDIDKIATKPDYVNPNIYADGTLDASGQDTIDISAQGLGMPDDGLYMFTYGNCQCFLTLTSTMIQNASAYPIRCTCPMMYNGSAYPGILKIERAADVLTLTVATAGVGNVTPSGFGWKLIKVM